MPCEEKMIHSHLHFFSSAKYDKYTFTKHNDVSDILSKYTKCRFGEVKPYKRQGSNMENHHTAFQRLNLVCYNWASIDGVINCHM